MRSQGFITLQGEDARGEREVEQVVRTPWLVHDNEEGRGHGFLPVNAILYNLISQSYVWILFGFSI